MKKTVCTLLISLGLAAFSQAQTVRESRLSVLDADRMGHSIEFNFDQKTLQDAWNKKCDEFKIKSKPSKGLDVYTAALIPDIHYEPVDIYIKIDKIDKAKSSFAMVISKGTTNFITSEDAKIIGNINHFLDKFITYAEQYKLALDIKEQEQEIKDTQKAYDKLVEDGKKLQEQIDKNKIDQANRTKELEALNKGLEELKLKVK